MLETSRDTCTDKGTGTAEVKAKARIQTHGTIHTVRSMMAIYSWNLQQHLSTPARLGSRRHHGRPRDTGDQSRWDKRSQSTYNQFMIMCKCT
eukprot:3882870-Pleurochrysis_carterae.AAC.4